MTENAVRRFDFTWFYRENADDKFLHKHKGVWLTEEKLAEEWKEEAKDIIMEAMDALASKWVFQLEEAPTTGEPHFQGRFHLKTKMRLRTLIRVPEFERIIGKAFRLSVTSSNTGKEFDYVMKEDSRIEGPWMDEAQEKKMKAAEPPPPPKATKAVTMLDEKGLLPWQQTLYDMSKTYDSRKIDVIYDTTGGIGKTVFKKWMKFHGHAHQVPIINNSKDLLQGVMSIIKAKGERNCFILDFPRSATQSMYSQLYAAVEDIKSGYCYDTRYKFEDIDFDEPRVFIFTNNLPPKEYLSADRWVFWKIRGLELVRFHPGEVMVPLPTLDEVDELRRRAAQAPTGNERTMVFHLL